MHVGLTFVDAAGLKQWMSDQACAYPLRVATACGLEPTLAEDADHVPEASVPCPCGEAGSYLVEYSG